MKSQIFLSSLIVSALVMSGCNTNTPAPITTTPDQPSTQAHQETTASISVVDQDTAMMEEDDSGVMDSAMEVDSSMEADAQMYHDYTEAKRTDLHGKAPYVLFFHADWCPTCRAMESGILADLSTFPEGTNILKADYDTEKTLKDEFDIRVQSTVIVFDAAGEVVWKGQDPAIDDLKEYITDSMI